VINFGIGVEANPIMAKLLNTPILFIVINVVAMFLLTLWIGKNEDKFGNIASWITCIAMLIIVIWNSIPIIIFYLIKGGII
jgi:hypothetical protein